MPETKVYASKVDNRAAQFGAAAGEGIASGLQEKLEHMANLKAEKIRAGHLQTLYPNASQAQLQALAALGPKAEENFFKGVKGVSAVEQASPQIKQIQAPDSPQLNFGGIQQTPVSSGKNNFSPVSNDQIQPIDYMNALGAVGMKMSPAQTQQFQKLPQEQQDKIVDDVYSKLPPKYQNQMQDFYNNALAKDLGEKKNQEVSQQQMQPQQVIGSPEPGVGPQQQSQQLDVGRALARGASGQDEVESSPQRTKQKQELNLKIKSTNEIDQSLNDIEQLLDNGDIQTGKIANSWAENGFLHNVTPDTASLYQAIQDLLVKQQTALAMGGRSSNEFRKTIASAKLNLGQPIPVMRKTLDKIRKATKQERQDLIDIRSGKDINEREQTAVIPKNEKPSQVVKSLDKAKVKDGARAKNLDTGEMFIFRDGKWEAE
jgi:hypothetical protein